MPMIHYIAGIDVDAPVDAALRKLLSTCFTKPGDEIFRERCYFLDPPKHRWYIAAPNGELIAHTAAHEKTAIWREKQLPLCGISEVCVHPDFRGRGYVREMLAVAHAFMKSRGFGFSALCGEQPEVYFSSGYRLVDNLMYRPEREEIPFPHAMVCELTDRPWPQDRVFLIGNFF